MGGATVAPRRQAAASATAACSCGTGAAGGGGGGDDGAKHKPAGPYTASSCQLNVYMIAVFSKLSRITVRVCRRDLNVSCYPT